MNKAIIRRSYKGIEEDLIFMDYRKGYYWPVTGSVKVYDRAESNVVIENGDFNQEDNGVFSVPCEYLTIPETRTITVSQEVLSTIKNMITESGVLKIRSFEGVNYAVMDGEANRIYFGVDGQRKLVECDNFFVLYDGCGEETNAGKTIKLVDSIEAYLNKEIKG